VYRVTRPSRPSQLPQPNEIRRPAACSDWTISPINGNIPTVGKFQRKDSGMATDIPAHLKDIACIIAEALAAANKQPK